MKKSRLLLAAPMVLALAACAQGMTEEDRATMNSAVQAGQQAQQSAQSAQAAAQRAEAAAQRAEAAANKAERIYQQMMRK
jgi:hypothetical protein